MNRYVLAIRIFNAKNPGEDNEEIIELSLNNIEFYSDNDNTIWEITVTEQNL